MSVAGDRARASLVPARCFGRTPALLAGLLFAVAVVAAYVPTLEAPLLFDDVASIRDNLSIRQLWPISGVLSPPYHEGATVGGRPILNLTLALNWAMSGPQVGSYHAVNLGIHLSAALLLGALVQITLRRPGVPARFQAGARSLATAIALLWALHPLQTAAVTAIIQRAESLAATFGLLTLYAFARGASSLAPRRWFALAVISGLGGIGTKETMVTAPVLVLLYDRTFFAGSFRAAWRQRRGLHLMLFATWLPLGVLVASHASRGGTAGLGGPLSSVAYAWTQCGAIVHYLGLTFLPYPLIFDYGLENIAPTFGLAPGALALGGLLGATLFSLWRAPAVGFLAAAFFVTLAPSSSVVPIASQLLAEHRMYLPLAALVTLLVLGVHTALGRRGRLVVAAVVVGWGTLTWRRNSTYRQEINLWQETVRHRPTNARALSNLGNALLSSGRAAEAVPHYETALRLSPGFADAHNNLGRALVQTGQMAAAVVHYEHALRGQPDSPVILTNLGSVLARQGRTAEALAVYERALQLDAGAVGARYNRGNLFGQLADFNAALADYVEVLRLVPEHVDARYNRAATLRRLNRLAEALAAYEDLVRRRPADAAAHAELGNLLAHAGRTEEARAHFEVALRLQPVFPAVRAALNQLRR